MNFFEQQDQSRHRTKLLIFLFVAAIAAMIFAIYFSIWIPYVHYMRPIENVGLDFFSNFRLHWWEPRLFMYVSCGTIGVILCGALYMNLSLSSGGPAVAGLLGGRPLSPNTEDPREKRLMNVVEEMSIAAGVCVPQVFILPTERSINAFAAGFTPSDTAIGVTQGTIDLLTRDELQGVIAHEFSHIFNGDMRINIRLTSLLHGILGIATIGYWILRFGSGGSSRSRLKGGPATPSIALFGLVFLIIGYIGVFFGRLIKSAVSRQRELLADAAAVQYTRDPLGIAGALKKIGGYVLGGKIQSHFAESVSHMFFGDAIDDTLGRLFESHPPLSERIKRLDPSFKDDYPDLKIDAAESPLDQDSAAIGFSGSPAAFTEEKEVFISVGDPQARHLEYAGAFLTSLPAPLVVAAHEPNGARSVICSLLLDTKDEIRQKQLDLLRSTDGEKFASTCGDFAIEIQKLGVRARMPLLTVSLPALRKLPFPELNQFLMSLRPIILADGEISLFEALVVEILRHHIGGGIRAQRRSIIYRSFGSVREDIRVLLSALAYEGAFKPEEAPVAFTSGWSRLEHSASNLLPRGECGVGPVHIALKHLGSASYSIRQEFLEAAAAVVASDGMVAAGEAEILRAFGECLDCPIPPVLPSK